LHRKEDEKNLFRHTSWVILKTSTMSPRRLCILEWAGSNELVYPCKFMVYFLSLIISFVALFWIFSISLISPC